MGYPSAAVLALNSSPQLDAKEEAGPEGPRERLLSDRVQWFGILDGNDN
jgi:hypothetical protein